MAARRNRPRARPWIAAALALFGAACAREPHTLARPNFVLILADDLGWADVGYQGSTFHRTPNLDALARAGVSFSNAYAAAPVCSPARAGLVTGRAPARLHLTSLLGVRTPLGELEERLDDAEAGELVEPTVLERLPADVPTIATVLSAAGYRTGWIGKWHLGSDPREHGFEFSLASTPWGSTESYFSPYGLSSLADGPPGEYLTDRLTDEALRFLDENRERPFLLVLSHYAPHTPLQAPPELVAECERRVDPAGRQRNPIYAAMIEKLDASVGRVRAALESSGLAERTLLLFTSDNGGFEEQRLNRRARKAGVGEEAPAPQGAASGHVTSNQPLRSGKGRLYEGGVRVPCIAWGGPVARSGTCDVPIVALDFLPTLAALAGAERPAVCDGVDLTPLLAQACDAGALRREALYFHFPHQSFASSLRRGDEKLIYSWQRESGELFDLAADPGELADLARERPERAAELQAELFRWLDAVGADRPVRAAALDPKR